MLNLVWILIHGPLLLLLLLLHLLRALCLLMLWLLVDEFLVLLLLLMKWLLLLLLVYFRASFLSSACHRRLAVISSLCGLLRLHHTMISRLPQRLIHHEHATTLGLMIQRLLLLQLDLDTTTQRHLTHVILARLGMVNTQSDQLATELALAVLELLTLLAVLDDTLKLHALGKRTVGIAAIDSMHERVQIDLDVWLGWLVLLAASRVLCLLAALAFIASRLGAGQELHLVLVWLALIALGTLVEVITNSAVIARLHLGATRVTSVHELLIALVVELIEQGHC